ncbi:hypothetical protein Csa_012476 [Cucumis sativus]|nr:hypothetical protein Csa_012476 [Cucumis sativus]
MSFTSPFEPIKDINDPQVQEIGNLTVDDHNKKTGENLKFVRVVNGLFAGFVDPFSPLGGTVYELVLEAINAGKINWTYKVKVSASTTIRPLGVVYNFQSFEPVLQYEEKH